MTEEESFGDTGMIPAATDPLVGVVLEQRYEIISKIGEGGMGTVYRGCLVSLGKSVTVAIKHLNATTPEMQERFEREARLLGRCSHPGVVKVRDFIRSDKGYFLVMDLIDGMTLEDVVRTLVPIPLEKVYEIFRDVCLAIADGHAKGVIHRDIKPMNVMVAQYGPRIDVKVLDYGVATLDPGHRTEEDERTIYKTMSGKNCVVGSPHTIAPEIWQAREATVRSDIYALGIVLYYMIAGRNPFLTDAEENRLPARYKTKTYPPRDEKTPGSGKGFVDQLRYKHMHAPPPDLQQFRSDRLPRDLMWVVEKALAKEPSERFASVMELLNSLDTALNAEEEESAASKPLPPPPSTPVLEQKRLTAIHLTGAAAAMLFLGVAVVLIYHGGRNSEKPVSPALTVVLPAPSPTAALAPIPAPSASALAPVVTTVPSAPPPALREEVPREVALAERDCISKPERGKASCRRYCDFCIDRKRTDVICTHACFFARKKLR